MSRISLSGNPSGTGTFTIASPNSNSDRTVSLPDSSGTVGVLASVTNNGVVFANSSGQPTTGSALTFDGTNFATTGNANLGSSGKSTDTQLNFAADTGTQRIYIERGSRSLVFSDVSSGLENYRIAGITGIQSWGVGGSEQMRLTSTGLGIGTSSPGYKLDVSGVGNFSDGVRIGTNSTAASGRIFNNATWGLGFVSASASTNAMGWFDSSVNNLMALSSSGNLGIGTTNPGGTATDRQLTVVGSTSSQLTVSSSTVAVALGATSSIAYLQTTGAHPLLFYTSNTARAEIDAAGRVGWGSQGTTGDRMADMSFQGVTLDAGSNQFGLVLNPTYSTGVTSTIFNLYTGPNLAPGTTVNNVYNLYLEGINAAGSTVNVGRWGLYQASSSDNNYFAGNVAVNNGITFPATQNASSNANTLDDYEEGTFTPRLSGGSGGEYTPSGLNAGRYIKIGKMVYITITLQWSARVTPYSGNLVVSGLPFSSASTYRWNGSIGAVNNGLSFNPGYGEWNFLIDPGYTFVYIIENSTSGSGYSHSPIVGTTGLVYSMSLYYEAVN